MFREQSFVPHSFRCDARFLPGRGPKKMPKIIISRKAYSLMWAYVDEGQEEVGWLGTAYRQDNGDFRIEEVFLFKQTVSATETEISTEGLSELAMELIQTGEKGMDACNNLRFWGHSHVRMGTSASGTDENTMVKSGYGYGGSYGRSTFCFQNDQVPWAIRGIFNKLGQAQFSIFLYEEGLRIDDVAWDVDPPPASTVAADSNAAPVSTAVPVSNAVPVSTAAPASTAAPVRLPPPLPEGFGRGPSAAIAKQTGAKISATTAGETTAQTDVQALGEAPAEAADETAEPIATLPAAKAVCAGTGTQSPAVVPLRASAVAASEPVRPKYGFFAKPSPNQRYLPDITVEMRAAIRAEFRLKVKSRGWGQSFWGGRNRSDTADDKTTVVRGVAGDDGVTGDFAPGEPRPPELIADWTTGDHTEAPSEASAAGANASQASTAGGVPRSGGTGSSPAERSSGYATLDYTNSGGTASSQTAANRPYSGPAAGSNPPVVSSARHGVEIQPQAGCYCASCIQARRKESLKSLKRAPGATAQPKGPYFAQPESRVTAFFRAIGKAIKGD